MFAGALVGCAFLTKMLQAFLVLPAFVLVYLLASRLTFRRNLVHLLAAFGAMVVAGGWWVAIVELWPGTRPYIGGSQTNSILELTLGYNGLGRLTGDETGSVGGGVGPGGGPGGGSGWGQSGLLRLFGSEIGGQVAWLLPAALLLLVVGLWLRRRTGRDDRVRTALLVWGGWLVVTGLTFSLMAGIFHPYYTVVLAPAIAAVVALGARDLWQRRTDVRAALTMAFVVAISTVTALVLLGRSDGFVPWLTWVVGVVGTGSAVALALGPWLTERGRVLAATAAVVALLAGPTAYTIDTVITPHTGSIPSAGPTVAGGFGPGGFGGPGGQGGPPGGFPGQVQGQTQGAPTGGMGGLLDGSTPSDEMVALLDEDSGSYTWVAATIGANNASGYQLATQHAVMPIGGFNGTDPSPTPAQFQAYVEAGEVHYFIAGGGMGGGGFGPGADDSTSTSARITSWVEANYSSTTVDGVTVYDLTQPTSGSTATDGSSL